MHRARLAVVLPAAFAALVLPVQAASAASPKTVSFTAICDGRTVSGSTIMNSSPVLVLDGQQALIRRQTAVNTATGATFVYSVVGFDKNKLPTTTCTLTVPYLPTFVFTADVYFTPARH